MMISAVAFPCFQPTCRVGVATFHRKNLSLARVIRHFLTFASCRLDLLPFFPVNRSRRVDDDESLASA